MDGLEIISLKLTSEFFTPWKGLTPSIRISQTQTPNIHTSDAVVNLRKLIDSGAIHLIGSFPFEAFSSIIFIDIINDLNDNLCLMNDILSINEVLICVPYNTNCLQSILTIQNPPALHSPMPKPKHS